MNDYYEIDFHKIDENDSGDALTIRYCVNDAVSVHIVDGGFLKTGVKLQNAVNKYYGNNVPVDNVVLTHPDGDHAGGLRYVLENMEVHNLWMLRPWLYSEELLPSFTGYTSADRLGTALRKAYPNVDKLEEIALEKSIPIHEPFQGQRIGHFAVTTPTKKRYLNLIRSSQKTPEAVVESASGFETLRKKFVEAKKSVMKLVVAEWGEEEFSDDETSAENEMSVSQFAEIDDKRILLTGDTGRSGLEETIRYLKASGVKLKSWSVFQVPHHGSRKNVSTDLLNTLLGPILPERMQDESRFSAIISCSDQDPDHPRNAVVRAMIHRGGRVVTTEKNTICCGHMRPDREGWSSATALDYPDTQEA